MFFDEHVLIFVIDIYLVFYVFLLNKHGIRSAFYPYLVLEIGTDGQIRTRNNGKRYNVNFSIVNVIFAAETLPLFNDMTFTYLN